MDKILIFGGILFLGWYFLKKSKNISKIKTKAIVIGDSQVPFIVYNTKNADMLGLEGIDSLWSGGKNLNWLNGAVKNHATDLTISHIFISIGTNGGFNLNDNIDDLMKNLRYKFPNAKIYYIKGSYGWGGNINISPVDVLKYSNKFSQYGAFVLTNGIGKTNEPHNSKLPSYKLIGEEIENILK